MDSAAIRRDYHAPPLLEGPDDPMALFHEWFSAACATSAIDDPTAFVLATVDSDGMPDTRVVLLKKIIANQFIFFTNYLSAKGLQLASNPHVALNFYWPFFSRQIRIRGVVEKVSRSLSIDYFNSRPHPSQASAFVSKQSQVVERKVLHQQFEQVMQQETIMCPDHWGGYAVTPNCFEFWHGQAGRLHDRLQYRLENKQWAQCILAP
jgi:pyridoxamine 5'-phosphate oxidase